MNGKFFQISLTSINSLLILLWTYAAVSKLSDYQTSRREMLNQALPSWLEEILVWGVPLIELFTAALLLFGKSRLYGTFLSLCLLISFTIYIGLIKFNYFDYIPCSCGGVIGSLSWEQHFVFNLIFIVLAATGVILETNRGELTSN
ncbi:MauE/DoxX family redox-associated membrane protein [Daejeonella sp.]|uniref:MauE/DoxX family redox-associated membrane protein n=1 Tax=Daejeonella sp. TaxID=2805397 RepID=UPI0030C35BA7